MTSGYNDDTVYVGTQQGCINAQKAIYLSHVRTGYSRQPDKRYLHVRDRNLIEFGRFFLSPDRGLAQGGSNHSLFQSLNSTDGIRWCTLNTSGFSKMEIRVYPGKRLLCRTTWIISRQISLREKPKAASQHMPVRRRNVGGPLILFFKSLITFLRKKTCIDIGQQKLVKITKKSRLLHANESFNFSSY